MEAKAVSDSHVERAKVLAEALPYIQKYYGKTVVVKYGGNAMISDELRHAVISDIILLHLVGVHVVVVHGGGPEISDMLKKIGKESNFVDGLRYTDRETMDVVQQVLCGKVNKNLTAMINHMGGHAVGLCGLDAGLFMARQLDEKYGLVGEVTHVNPAIVNDSLNDGYIPVISSIGVGAEGESYNINADTAAARIAAALNAECLISMTDIAGVLRDKDDPASLIPYIGVSEAPQLMRDGVICGGMIPKIECCIEAIRRGVKKVFVLNGTVPHAILIEILTNEGIGTMFC